MQRFTGLIGLAVILFVAWLLSKNRDKIRWSTIVWGVILQFALGGLVIAWPGGANALKKFSDGITGAIAYSDAGAEFVFGWLATPAVGGKIGAATGIDFSPFIFAFKVMPIVIFIASFFTILYYLGIMQRVVQVFAIVMTKLLKVSGAESLAVAANIFIGQTEAPIIIAPYIPKMTKSELLTMMTGGMAHISGAVLLAYAAMGIPANYLITASVMAAPATIVIAKLLRPEVEEPQTAGTVKVKIEHEQANVIEAAAAGASQGVSLAINICGMLIAFIALISLFNGLLGLAGPLFGFAEPGPGVDPATTLSLQWLFSKLLWPLAWVMGVPAADCSKVARLIGFKTVINEFVAYAEMSKIPMSEWTEKGRLIASFALCGFANFSSIGIQIGGIGGLAPSRKSDIARLGLWALLAGSLATFMSATIAGILKG
ncbi:NupC/NupG family nucleoside CNT transporter [Acidobacteria bacterium ACD]|nr:MAG: NupC/NupG family nucleoside CNT transporter [Acidobacteriota bacterium]MCE7958281.1 NupC/NupG family nucleoside CNT transporter [Acidobacteria bacterium ACB2]MDL1950635.1 NupC/NupG family nucleoside CNT transporter [Acidobacteria bacterium ACD]